MSVKYRVLRESCCEPSRGWSPRVWCRSCLVLVRCSLRAALFVIMPQLHIVQVPRSPGLHVHHTLAMCGTKSWGQNRDGRPDLAPVGAAASARQQWSCSHVVSFLVSERKFAAGSEM